MCPGLDGLLGRRCEAVLATGSFGPAHNRALGGGRYWPQKSVCQPLKWSLEGQCPRVEGCARDYVGPKLLPLLRPRSWHGLSRRELEAVVDAASLQAAEPWLPASDGVQPGRDCASAAVLF